MIKSPRGHPDINEFLHCNLFIYHGPIYIFRVRFFVFNKTNTSI